MIGPMTKVRDGVLILTALVSLCGCDPARPLNQLSAGETGRVTSVTAGDVLTLDSGLVVRLAEVQAPYQDQPGAEASRADLQRLVGGQKVRLFYGGARRDAYGRALAQVRRENGRLWVQALLLRDGWARVRTYADNHALVAPLLNDEAEARQARRGLWAMPDYGVRLPSEVGPDLREFQIVEGRVISVTPARSGDYLEFSADRRGFAVQIPASARAQMQAGGMEAENLVGRMVRVRGNLGWNEVMRVDHPQQIERLREP